MFLNDMLKDHFKTVMNIIQRFNKVLQKVTVNEIIIEKLYK